MKGDKLSRFQCSQEDDQRAQMQAFPYASVVDSLMYAQVCTRLDITYVVGDLGDT